MNKNLPIIKKNTELTLSKTKSLINVTSKILSNKKRFEGLIEKENNALVDDSWMERLWAWADEKKISDNTLPRNKVELLRLKRLFLSAILYEEWGYPYTVPHCQDHLKKILIPPTYDTLSNIFIASNS